MLGSKFYKNRHKRHRSHYARVSMRFGAIYQPRRLRREWAAAMEAMR